MRKGFEVMLLMVCIVLMAIGLKVQFAIAKNEPTSCDQSNYIAPKSVSVRQQIERNIPEIVFEPSMENISFVIPVSNADIDLMARVVMSESSILSNDTKQAIAQTIVNRVISDKYPNTVSEVIYQPNQYSTHDNGEPTVECYNAVYNALQYVAFPRDMFWFRNGQYHSFAYAYMNIENTYFSCATEH